MFSVALISHSIDADHDQCVNYKRCTLANENRRQVESLDEFCLTSTPVTSVTSSTIQKTKENTSLNQQPYQNRSNKQSNKPSNRPTADTQSQSSSTTSSQEYETIDCPIKSRPTFSSASLNQSDLHGRHDVRHMLNFDTENLSSFNETDSMGIFIEKINKLSLKVSQQALLLKEKDAEIKRLVSTTIGKRLPLC